MITKKECLNIPEQVPVGIWCKMEEHSKTTRKDFEFLKKECAWWIDKLNLRSWHFTVVVDTDVLPGNYGEWVLLYEARQIIIKINPKLPTHNRKKLLKELAYHEVFEAGVLGRIKTLAGDRNFSQQEINSEIHSIVNRCQNLLMPLRDK